MTETEHGDGTADLDGYPVEQAVDLAAESADSPKTVQETLAIVAQDGVVRRAAVDDALANASKVVTTAETRAELANNKLNDVRDVAESVSDLDLVSARIDTFAERLDVIETQADELGQSVQEILDMKSHGDLYEIAQRIRRLTNAATEVQRAADDFQFELDSFEAWLTDGDRRTEELTADLDAVAESVADLDDSLNSLEVDSESSNRDAARTWAVANIRHSVVSLMIADLRAELATLRTWAEREGDTPPPDVGPRLDDIRDRHNAVGERLSARAEPEWRTRYSNQLTAVDNVLEEKEPPVSWTEIEAAIEEYRPKE